MDYTVHSVHCTVSQHSFKPGTTKRISYCLSSPLFKPNHVSNKQNIDSIFDLTGIFTHTALRVIHSLQGKLEQCMLDLT